MRWVILILAAVTLAACAYETKLVSGAADQVTIQAGQYANPGPPAIEHCARYGKTAELVAAMGTTYKFRCVPR